MDVESPKLVVASEGRNYALYLNNNSSGHKDGLPFSTYDHDNDQSFYSNCAKVRSYHRQCQQILVFILQKYI